MYMKYDNGGMGFWGWGMMKMTRVLLSSPYYFMSILNKKIMLTDLL